MFELKLVDVFSTLCVGSVTVLLGIYIYFLFSKLFIPEKFDNEKFVKWIRELLAGSVKDNWYAFLTVVIIYFSGIIAGDLTGRMTDSDASKGSILSVLRTCTVMESEGDLRKETLMHLHSDSSVTGLGTAIFLNRQIVDDANFTTGTVFFASHPNTKGELMAQWADVKEKLQKNDTAFTRFVFQIYYTAKNWVYSKEHEPLKELKDIQHRIDLSRSIVLILASGIIVLCIMGVAYTVFYFSVKYKSRDTASYQFSIKGVVIAFILMMICRECYHINEINYLKRAFGYYVSHIQEKERDAQKKGIDQPCTLTKISTGS